MTWIQKEITLTKRPRGFHLITGAIVQKVPAIQNIKTGLVHFLLKHTSASLALNENFDPAVRKDMENYFNHSVKENEPYFTHTSEGSDDMPAHIKSSILGTSLTLPITNGQINLGTWQGIYLCEHRNYGGARRVLVTLEGE